MSIIRMASMDLVFPLPGGWLGLEEFEDLVLLVEERPGEWLFCKQHFETRG